MINRDHIYMHGKVPNSIFRKYAIFDIRVQYFVCFAFLNMDVKKVPKCAKYANSHKRFYSS
jgi:hypothetical protein